MLNCIFERVPKIIGNFNIGLICLQTSHVLVENIDYLIISKKLLLVHKLFGFLAYFPLKLTNFQQSCQKNNEIWHDSL